MQPFADARKLQVAVVSGVEVQGPVHVRNISVVNAAIDLDIPGHFFHRHVAAEMQVGIALDLFHGCVAVIGVQIYIAITAGDGDVSFPCGHGKSNLPGQLQVEIEPRLLKIPAGKIQKPDSALLCELGMGGLIQPVCAALGIRTNNLVNHGMCLVVFTGAYADVALVAEDLDLRSSRQRLGKIVSKFEAAAPEPPIPVRIDANIVSYARPVPVHSSTEAGG